MVVSSVIIWRLALGLTLSKPVKTLKLFVLAAATPSGSETRLFSAGNRRNLSSAKIFLILSVFWLTEGVIRRTDFKPPPEAKCVFEQHDQNVT